MGGWSAWHALHEWPQWTHSLGNILHWFGQNDIYESTNGLNRFFLACLLGREFRNAFVAGRCDATEMLGGRCTTVGRLSESESCLWWFIHSFFQRIFRHDDNDNDDNDDEDNDIRARSSRGQFADFHGNHFFFYFQKGYISWKKSRCGGWRMSSADKTWKWKQMLGNCCFCGVVVGGIGGRRQLNDSKMAKLDGRQRVSIDDNSISKRGKSMGKAINSKCFDMQSERNGNEINRQMLAENSNTEKYNRGQCAPRCHSTKLTRTAQRNGQWLRTTLSDDFLLGCSWRKQRNRCEINSQVHFERWMNFSGFFCH